MATLQPVQPLDVVEAPIRLVQTPSQARQMVEAYLTRPHLPLAFDLETTGLDPRTGKLITAQFHQEGHPVAVVDLRVEDFAVALAPLFDGRLLIVGHNLKFDIRWLMQHYAIYPTNLFDTLLAEQVILGLGRSDAKKQGMGLGLKDLLHRYLGVEMSKAERNWFIDLDQRPDEWNAPLPPEQIEYGAADVRLLPELMRLQIDRLTERGVKAAAKLEMRALPAIATIEQSGVRVDVDGWRAFIAEKEQEAAALESQALEVFGSAILAARTQVYDTKLAEYNEWEQARKTQEEALRRVWESDEELRQIRHDQWGKAKIEWMQEWRKKHPNPGKPKPDQSLPNLGSPTQLLTAFHQMGIPVNSTASEVLGDLEEEHPEVRLLLDYRRASKFVQSFGEALLQYAVDGRISPEYVQIGASTGRMSCTRPNWQQVPSKGDGKRLRELVIADPGNVLLTADFSNIELRILADITGDQTMLRLFAEGLDLHSYTARMMFGLEESVDVAHVLLPGSDVPYRAVAKVINFGLVYGMSPMKLSRTVKVSKERAQELMDAYFRLYPGVAEWMQARRKEGLERLRSITLGGRKRFYALPTRPRSNALDDIRDWRDETRRARSRIERQAMNTPIQGTSADITKLALALLYESGILQNGMDLARIVAVVHDEIVLECAAEMSSLVAEVHARAMGDAAATYLKRVYLPPVCVVVGDHWSKE